MAPPRESVGRVLTKHIEHDGPDNGPVAIVIPAFNESESLPKTLSKIPHNQINDLHVIVVDDGSTDDTAILAESYGAKTVISHDRNQGLGAALRTGLKAARKIDARAAIYIDADGEYDPSEIPTLLKEIDSGRADYVLGNRIVKKGERQKFGRQFGNRLFTTLLSIACGRRIKDGQTGFRAFSRNAIEVAEIIHDYNYAQVLTLDLLKKGLRLTEVPISWRRRRFGKSFINWQYLWRVPVGMAREMWSS
ncbi:MAG: glycosyltransferase family 2 protein [SAR202 cluster bacterium]|nr:glycosyltransferase family 2 protein [SAR202 cluster bacterium]